MTSKIFRADALHVFSRHVACLFLVFSISCPAALSERRVDSDGYVINDLLRLEQPLPEALRVADTWDYSEQFFFLDRDMTQDASETKSWSEEDKKLVTSRLRYVHRKWPELFTNLGHKVCFYRAENIKDPAKPSAKSSTIAATIYRTITFSDIFFRLPDYEEVSTLVHELVHVIDTGHPVSHSPVWVTFVRKSPSLIRADGKYEEALADYIAEYFTSSSQPRSTEFEEKIYKPFFQTKNESLIRYSGLYRAGAMAMHDRDYSNAILLLEKAIFENQSSPSPNYLLAAAYHLENRESDALRSTETAERQLKALGVEANDPDWIRLAKLKVAICLRLNAIADVRALLEKLRSANPENPQIADLTRQAQELERKLIAKPRNTKQVRAPIKKVESK